MNQVLHPPDSPEARLRRADAIFKHAGEGVIYTTPAGRIFDVNESFVRITGYSRAEVLGKRPSILQSGRQGPAFYQAMWKALRADGYWHGEVWNRRKNGEVYAELLTISAVHDTQGELEGYVGIFSDITAQRTDYRELERLAYYDVLTGLPNRRLLAERLGQALAQARRRQTLFAVAYIDLDGFKPVNDRYGHACGDDLLVALSSRMRQSIRDDDTLARMGGDEFVVLLQNLTSEADCLPFLLRLRQACARPLEVHGQTLQVSASIGVAFCPRDGTTDVESLIEQADQAMYRAKRAGKNCYRFF
jgi:diguanylate cyclase (GGDEF)-like protein/PAS domain S-box-containing protein